MPISPRIIIIPALACLAIACTTVKGAYYNNVKQALCNPDNFDVDPYYPFTVAFVDQIVGCTGDSYDSSCSISQTYKEGHLWGHGECSQHLEDFLDCSYCISAAKDKLYKRCNTRATGAQIRLVDCSLRYEAYEFTADPLS